MSYLRFKALDQVNNRGEVKALPAPTTTISEYFGQDVFGKEEMQKTLSAEVFRKVSVAITNGDKIDKKTANSIAVAVKNWAVAKGITHYTHWFQPLTGATAEKHDSFFDAVAKIEKFEGSTLAQQEPDASSFPNGGIRSTFEARGYTAWDPSSPMFVYGRTLCIPTVFVAYTGEALDNKAPLLKAIVAVDNASVRVCQYFGKSVNKVKASLGCEQEYFVVDKALYAARPDLVMTGRTVFGHNPARGQQLDDHYFGSIPNRVYDFMKEYEIQALKLGIPVSTRHNEVAPSQFEVAPLFEELNIANDHNQLLMDVMNRVAERHNLKVLFHEKPFAELNGNGKHNNFSLITNTGVNLFAPSNSAKENLQFLSFFVNTIKAVHVHADLLRASTASAGNDHRLGANEAPPAIMSVFIGKQLTEVLDELENKGNVKVEKGENMYMKLGIDKIPEIILDNTDRNRTSPFAFTGNKFEFRAVGANENCASAMTILSLIIANQLTEFADEVDALIANGKEKRMAIVIVLRKYIEESKEIRFEGDGYSQDWVKEAAKRKLSNIKSTPKAIEAYLSKKSKKLFKAYKIMGEEEVGARQEIKLQNYKMKIQIESRVMGDLVLNHIIPTAVAYQNKLINNANGLKGLGIDNSDVVAMIGDISKHIHVLNNEVKHMIEERKEVNKIEDAMKLAISYNNNIKEKYFDKIRHAVDKLELLVDDEDWPLVKYRELLFLR